MQKKNRWEIGIFWESTRLSFRSLSKWLRGKPWAEALLVWLQLVEIGSKGNSSTEVYHKPWLSQNTISARKPKRNEVVVEYPGTGFGVIPRWSVCCERRNREYSCIAWVARRSRRVLREDSRRTKHQIEGKNWKVGKP